MTCQVHDAPTNGRILRSVFKDDIVVSCLCKFWSVISYPTDCDIKVLNMAPNTYTRVSGKANRQWD